MPIGDSTTYGPVLYEARPTGEQVFKDWLLPLGISLVLSPLVIRWKSPEMKTTEVVVWVGVMLVLVTLIFVLVWLRRRRANVQVTASHVVRARLIGRDAAPRAELSEAVLAQRYAVPGMPSPVLFLIDASTSTRLRLSGPVWSEEDLRTIGEFAPRLTVVPVLGAEEARPRWPKMMPWSNRHPMLALGVGGLGMLVSAAVFGALLFWLVS